MTRTERAWNHNTYHHRTLLRLIPAHLETALDIGCGDGSFAALLAERTGTVLAIDLDPAQVEASRRRCAAFPNVRVEKADLLECDGGIGQFDLITVLASLHHMPFEAAATRIDQLLKPGGRLVVLGVWTDSKTAWDLLLNYMSTALNMVLRRLRGPDVMTAPATMPTMTYSEVKHAAQKVLPGARIKRRTLWRYTLTWDKPNSQ